MAYRTCASSPFFFCFLFSFSEVFVEFVGNGIPWHDWKTTKRKTQKLLKRNYKQKKKKTSASPKKKDCSRPLSLPCDR